MDHATPLHTEEGGFFFFLGWKSEHTFSSVSSKRWVSLAAISSDSGGKYLRWYILPVTGSSLLPTTLSTRISLGTCVNQYLQRLTNTFYLNWQFNKKIYWKLKDREQEAASVDHQNLQKSVFATQIICTIMQSISRNVVYLHLHY